MLVPASKRYVGIAIVHIIALQLKKIVHGGGAGGAFRKTYWKFLFIYLAYLYATFHHDLELENPFLH